MAKRIVTKIGDVFCAEIEGQCKRFFQYFAIDSTQLNSSVIRVFKQHYRGAACADDGTNAGGE